MIKKPLSWAYSSEGVIGNTIEYSVITFDVMEVCAVSLYTVEQTT
jgi:hypothetical protein